MAINAPVRPLTATMPPMPQGRWVRSLKTWTCHKCGGYIPAGETYLRFSYPAPSNKADVCRRCATGEE